MRNPDQSKEDYWKEQAMVERANSQTWQGHLRETVDALSVMSVKKEELRLRLMAAEHEIAQHRPMLSAADFGLARISELLNERLTGKALLDALIKAKKMAANLGGQVCEHNKRQFDREENLL